MKIAVIRRECVFTKGGAERYAANLCRELARIGHEVFVLAEKCDPDLHPGITHISIPVSRLTSSSRNKSFHANSQKAIKQLQPDVVLALSRSFPADAFRVSDPLHTFWMSIRYPNRMNRFFQRLNPRHRTILQLEREILDPENTHCIITNSRLSKKIIGETSPFPLERIHVIYNGVDHEQFTPGNPVGEKREAIRLLFVGQDFKRKGLGPLIQAFAAVRNRGVRCHLRVIGRDNPKPYENMAADLGVTDHLSFEGPMRAIEEAYRAADLFVFPSLYDPFANTCLEALACGLPVLTTTTNGSSEVVTDGIDGFIVDGSAEGLAARLARKIEEYCAMTAEKREEMKLFAVRKAAQYTIENNAQAMVEVLKQKDTHGL